MADTETKFIAKDENGYTLVSLALKTSIRGRRTELNTTATALPSSNLSGRRAVYVKNTNAAGDIWIGGSDVNDSDKGYRLSPGQSVRLEISDDSSVTVYGVKASGAGTMYASTLEVA